VLSIEVPTGVPAAQAEPPEASIKLATATRRSKRKKTFRYAEIFIDHVRLFEMAK
jgi:hypothetical protein